MDVTNIRVKHEKFGYGTITKFDGIYMTISFLVGEKKFVYPEAFEKYLQATDPEEQSKIFQEIALARQVADTKKIAVESGQIKFDSRKDNENIASCNVSKRLDGKRMTFYVFQGSTFDRESRGGYIWAPISNKAGKTFHHWEKIQDIRRGDIILHGYNGQVAAISVTRGECYECLQPDELKIEDLWDQEGRKVDCDYLQISFPIKTSDFHDDIKRLCKTKYSPFDKDGNGNMGYLYELNHELAKIFISATVKQNKQLAAVDFINIFLKEYI